jgi:transposase
MKIATEETRALVVKAYLAGTADRKKLSEIFGYTRMSIGNWIRDYERELRFAPRQRGHRTSVFTQEERERLVELLQENARITLAEIREHFHKECSLAAIHKLVAKLGFAPKKHGVGKREKRGKTPRVSKERK